MLFLRVTSKCSTCCQKVPLLYSASCWYRQWLCSVRDFLFLHGSACLVTMNRDRVSTISFHVVVYFASSKSQPGELLSGIWRLKRQLLCRALVSTQCCNSRKEPFPVTWGVMRPVWFMILCYLLYMKWTGFQTAGALSSLWMCWFTGILGRL